MADELNEKQRRFVNEYLVDLNATQAALRAKYSAKTAAFIGAENLKKPKIQKAIQEARECREKARKITSEWIIAQVARIAEDPETQRRDQLKALEMLGKYCGTWEKPQDQDSGIRVVIESEAEGWSV